MIFISHSTEDDEFVNQLSRSLKRDGFKTWVDHQDMPPSVAWVKHLEEMLLASDVLILVLSEKARQSAYVEAEWHTFFSLKRPIITIRLDQCQAPLFLSTFHQIVFNPYKGFEEQMRDLASVLDNLLGIQETRGDSATIEHTGKYQPVLPLACDESLELAQALLEEYTPTLLPNSVLIILPSEREIVQYDLSQALEIGRFPQTGHTSTSLNLKHYQGGLKVSRQHALLFQESKTLYIQDLDSTNGTYLNGERLKAQHAYALPNYSVLHFSEELALVVRYL